jgi:predicted peroxiredoxin
MAIAFSTKVLTQKKIPVTIYLTVEGVRIVDKNIPEHRHANGKSLKEMLSRFMEEGGRVIACGMCMKNVGGIEKDEVIEGVEFAGGMSALFEEGTTVLSY